MDHVRPTTRIHGVLPIVVRSLVLAAVFLALGVAVSGGEPGRADRLMSETLHRHSSEALTRLMRPVTDLGSDRIAIPLMLAFVGWLLWTQRRQTALLVAAFWIAAKLTSGIAKVTFDRERPSLFPALGDAGGYSYPSGHTITAVMTYGLIAAVLMHCRRGNRRWIAIGLAAAVMVAVALSRVYLGVHYLTDVIGGMLIAGAWLQIAIHLLGRIEPCTQDAGPERQNE